MEQASLRALLSTSTEIEDVYRTQGEVRAYRRLLGLRDNLITKPTKLPGGYTPDRFIPGRY